MPNETTKQLAFRRRRYLGTWFRYGTFVLSLSVPTFVLNDEGVAQDRVASDTAESLPLIQRLSNAGDIPASPWSKRTESNSQFPDVRMAATDSESLTIKPRSPSRGASEPSKAVNRSPAKQPSPKNDLQRPVAGIKWGAIRDVDLSTSEERSSRPMMSTHPSHSLPARPAMQQRSDARTTPSQFESNRQSEWKQSVDHDDDLESQEFKLETFSDDQTSDLIETDSLLDESKEPPTSSRSIPAKKTSVSKPTNSSRLLLMPIQAKRLPQRSHRITLPFRPRRQLLSE
jgi:hypothetical protein